MIRARLELGANDLVVELASNDGYLLQHFVGTGVPILGIDPAANVAEDAEARGVPTLVAFFGRETAQRLVDEGKQARASSSETTFSHRYRSSTTSSTASASCSVHDGTATFEFPHLLHLLDRLEYDTIYHEHFSYFSLATFVEIVHAQGLDVYDVEELRRTAARFACTSSTRTATPGEAAVVGQLLEREEEAEARVDRSATRGSPRRSRSRSERSSTS